MRVRDAVAAILAGRHAREKIVPGYRQAAVLLPLYETPAGVHFVLTKRTERVPTHKGQISFPGGGFQDGTKRKSNRGSRLGPAPSLCLRRWR